MLITLLLTTMAGLGAIKLRTFALENNAVKFFLSQFNGSSSMEHRAAPFEFGPSSRISGPFHGTDPSGRWPRPWQAHTLPQPPDSSR